MPPFSRPDFVLTRGVLVAVAVVAPVFLVALPLAQWVGGGELVLSGPSGHDAAELGRLLPAAPGARLLWDGDVQARLAHASAGLWLGLLAAQALLAATVAAVALLVRYVVGQIQRGRPFTRSSLRALRAAGLVVAVAAVVVPMADAAVAAAAMHRATADHVISLTYRLNPLALLAGVLLLALAEAFRVGTELADDVEGLV